MKIYEIEIKEILARTVEIEAATEGEAIQKVENSYKNEEIVLDYTDFQAISIKNKEETDNHKESMMDIINYLYRDEERHFEEYEETDESRKNHIFLKIIEVKKFLESNS